jgi:trk system potassium uptake protein TrkH
MRFATIQRILGLLLMVSSITMLPPLTIALWLDESSWLGFTLTLFGIRCAGTTRNYGYETVSWWWPFSG